MKMEQTECSEMSAYKLQTPGNYPKESIQHTEYSESLKSRTINLFVRSNRTVQWCLVLRRGYVLEYLVVN